MPNARVRNLCGVRMGMDEKIDESVLRWFGNIERMDCYYMRASVWEVGQWADRKKMWIDYA